MSAHQSDCKGCSHITHTFVHIHHTAGINTEGRGALGLKSLNMLNLIAHIHEELCSTLHLDLSPYSVSLLHHSVVVGLGVGTTDDSRTAMGTTTTVQGRELWNTLVYKGLVLNFKFW